MSGLTVDAGKTFTCKHLLQGAPDCVFCHRDQLRQELSLAEEGLANYEEEMQARIKLIQQKDAELEHLRAYQQQMIDILKENAALRALLTQAPIAKVIVREDEFAEVLLYAPGLPPGEHDVYLMPEVPESDQHPRGDV